MKFAALAAALAVLSCASCALGPSTGAASVRVSVALPGARSLDASASAKLLSPDTSYIVVQVSGADMSTITGRGNVDNASRTASVAIRNIPVSRQERTITVSAYSAADLLLSSGSSAQTLKSGQNAVNVSLTPAAGTTTALSSATWQNQLTFTADSQSGVFELSFTESGDHCLSLGYSSAEFRVYDAAGRPLAPVGGTPENWYLVRDDPSRKCFVMISTGNANETLTVERAVYVVPGSPAQNEDGSRENPYHSFQQVVYNLGTAPCRFLLARGVYEGVNVRVVQGKSIYGGFDPSSWTRNLSPSLPMTELRGDAGSGDGILHSSALASPPDGSTVVDGVWLRANQLSSINPATAYSTIYFPYSPSVQNCRITGPDMSADTLPGLSSRVLYFRPNGTAVLRIVGNQISAGSISASTNSTSQAALYGLYADGGSPNLLIAENEIDGGFVASGVAATQIDGSAVYLGGEAWFVNNTVGSGKLANSGSSNIHCVVSMTPVSSLHIINNVLFDMETTTSGITSSCLEAAAPGRRPVHIMNNCTELRVGQSNPQLCCAYYFDDGTTTNWEANLTPLASHGIGVGTDINGNAGIDANNISALMNSTDFNVFGDPSQLSSSILGHDWSLGSTAPRELLYGAVGYSTLTSPQVNLPKELLPYLLHDRLGNARNGSRWSMGAYQYPQN